MDKDALLEEIKKDFTNYRWHILAAVAAVFLLTFLFSVCSGDDRDRASRSLPELPDKDSPHNKQDRQSRIIIQPAIPETEKRGYSLAPHSFLGRRAGRNMYDLKKRSYSFDDRNPETMYTTNRGSSGADDAKKGRSGKDTLKPGKSSEEYEAEYLLSDPGTPKAESRDY